MRLGLITILTLALQTSSKADTFQDKYGIGIIIVNGTVKWGEMTIDKYTIYLYDSIADNIEPSKTYVLYQGADDYLDKYKELNYKGFDGSLLMLCVDKKGDWYKVRIKDDREYWTKQSKLTYPAGDNYNFYSWEQFIAKTIWVSRLDKNNNPIRQKPGEKAKAIKFDAPECLRAVSTSGYWLKITPENGEGCFDDNYRSI